MRQISSVAPKALEESQVSLTTASSSLACFVMTEAELDRVADDAEPTSLTSRMICGHQKRNFEMHKHSSPGPIRSSTCTVASKASTASSAFDMDMDMDSDFDLELGTPQHEYSPAPEAMAPEFSASVSMSGMSIVSSLDGSPLKPCPRSSPPNDLLTPHPVPASGEADPSLGPQLVMPSLTIPRRRPYTEIGKSLGKLKLLVAGRPDTGKRSLLKALAQTCEHIVHVDPAMAPAPNGIVEISASTRPRPRWRMKKTEDVSSGKSQDFFSDELLDRNISFVISTASAQAPSVNTIPENQYVEAQLSCLREKLVDDADLEALVGSGSVPIVDAMLYLLPYTGLEHSDIEILRSLQYKTNVIPLLAKADTLDPGNILAGKQRIQDQLRENGIQCFSFHDAGLDVFDDRNDFVDIFAVSGVHRSDHDILDASILMNSDYVQPILETDLVRLTQLLFSVDGCPLLRHSAARKCLRWRTEAAPTSPLHMALARRDPLRHAISPVLTANPFAPRKFWEYVEVSDWARCLRRSLEAERAALVNYEKGMSEIYRKKVSRDLVKQGGKARTSKLLPEPNLQHQDPLGLLCLGSHLKRNGSLAAELVSSVGIIGCLVSWAGEWGWP